MCAVEGGVFELIARTAVGRARVGDGGVQRRIERHGVEDAIGLYIHVGADPHRGLLRAGKSQPAFFLTKPDTGVTLGVECERVGVSARCNVADRPRRRTSALQRVPKFLLVGGVADGRLAEAIAKMGRAIA